MFLFSFFNRKPKSANNLETVEAQTPDESSSAAKIKQWYVAENFTEITGWCVGLLSTSGRLPGVANVLNKLSPSEQKKLIAHWREKGKQDSDCLLLAAYFSPLTDLIADEAFLTEVRGQLGVHLNSVLKRQVDARITFVGNTDHQPQRDSKELNLEGFDAVKMVSNKKRTSSILNCIDGDLTGANLKNMLCQIIGSQVKLTNASLTNSKLAGSDFINATLVAVNAQKADLSKANLTGAKCEGADFSGANLAGANLTNTTLTNANLKNADLRNATWSDPLDMDNIRGANLFGAKLSDDAKDLIRRAVSKREDELMSEFKPFADYFENWKATHSSLRSFISGTPPFEKYLAALYLMGATNQKEFEERYKEIPERVKTSKYKDSFAAAADKVKTNLSARVESRMELKS